MKLYIENHRGDDETHVVTRLQSLAADKFLGILVAEHQLMEVGAKVIAMLHLGERRRFKYWFDLAAHNPNVTLIFCSSEPQILNQTLSRIGTLESDRMFTLACSPEVFLESRAETFFQSIADNNPSFELLEEAELESMCTRIEEKFSECLAVAFNEIVGLPGTGEVNSIAQICERALQLKDRSHASEFPFANLYDVFEFSSDSHRFCHQWAVTSELNGPFCAPREYGEEILLEFSQRKGIVVIEADLPVSLGVTKFGQHLSAASWCQIVIFALMQRKMAVPHLVLVDVRTDENKQLDMGRKFLLDACFNGRTHVSGRCTYFQADWESREAVDLLEHLFSIPERDTREISNAGISVIDGFIQQWWRRLAESNSRTDHHSLNNLLGPISLAKDLGESVRAAVVASNVSKGMGQESQMRAAMMSAMTWASMIADPKHVVDRHLLEDCGQDFRNLSKNCGELRFLLVDDHGLDGWSVVLASLLGMQPVEVGRVVGPFTETARRTDTRQSQLHNPDASAPDSLWVATDAVAVLERVCVSEVSILQSTAGTHSLCKHLQLTKDIDEGAVFSEVLLLDLRLFDDDPDRELSFLKSTAAAYFRQTNEHKDWLLAIEKATFRESGGYLDSLTCFAQVISNVDFAYPILIWSSTSQRKVAEGFKSYPNIFTGLEKPRLDSYFENDADKLRKQIASAVSHAIRATQFHDFLIRLSSADKQSTFINELRHSGTSEPEKYSHAELYVDETGSIEKNNLSIGGLLVFYKNAETADQFDEDLSNEWRSGEFKIVHCAQNSPTFTDEIPSQSNEIEQTALTTSFRGINRMPKQLQFGHGGIIDGVRVTRENYRKLQYNLRCQLGTEFKNRLNEKGARSLFIQIGFANQKQDVVPDHSEHDRIFYFLLNQLFRYVQGVFCASQVPNLSFYVSTRQRVRMFQNLEETESEIDSIRRRYGITAVDCGNGKVSFSSLSSNGMLAPIIFASESFLSNSADIPKTDVARADTLYYGTGIDKRGNLKIERQHRRQMYYADDMLADFKPYREAGFQRVSIKTKSLDDRDASIGVLESAHCLHRGDLKGGLLTLYKIYLNQTSDLFGENGAAVFVASYCSKKIIESSPNLASRRAWLSEALEIQRIDSIS